MKIENVNSKLLDIIVINLVYHIMLEFAEKTLYSSIYNISHII